MLYQLKWNGIAMTYYYAQYDTKKINAEELANICKEIRCNMICIKVLTTIRDITLQDKIKPMDMISPI
ncbi:unknown similar to AMEV043 [Mythimna separata entomopoxvirus 'L']|uniref:Uncharacterized protein n=1 Tax=Mythimna separata entomopoxvirus 'L' TaxID=1293572 RepID=A0A916KQ22_9POXV|nr:unknown similar to AMEV043 [Mythimna separata entomopoxvirus 'L']CCU56267.1 unknown similar to AMEV043 [Mythimna separata entomopoxvirus 'L']